MFLCNPANDEEETPNRPPGGSDPARRPDDPTALEAISPDQVEAWAEATTKFIGSFLGEIAIKLPLAETTAKQLLDELAAKTTARRSQRPEPDSK